MKNFQKPILQKKVDIHDQLMEHFWEITMVFEEVNEMNESAEERMKIWHSKVLNFMSWMDRRFLFLGEELTVHIGMILIRAGEYLEGTGMKKEDIYQEFGKTKALIKQSIGLEKIELNFSKTSSARISSKEIKYYLKLKKEHNKR